MRCPRNQRRPAVARVLRTPCRAGPRPCRWRNEHWFSFLPLEGQETEPMMATHRHHADEQPGRARLMRQPAPSMTAAAGCSTGRPGPRRPNASGVVPSPPTPGISCGPTAAKPLPARIHLSRPGTVCNGMSGIGVSLSEMRTLSHRGAPRQSPQQAPVFADVSGRRRRRMRLLGLVAGGVMAACLVVMAVGLLGGPRASFVPWAGLDVGSSTPAGIGVPGEAGSSPTQRAPDPSALPSPAPDRSPSTRPGGSSSPAASGSSSPAASASSSPTVTNRATKTPPGRNRSPSPHPSRAASVL
jgi:hypothetical protein